MKKRTQARVPQDLRATPKDVAACAQAEAAISRRRGCVMETFRLPEEGIHHVLGVG